MHVKEGKPEQFTPEEGSAFDEADTLFRGLVISVLGDTLLCSCNYTMEQFLEYRMVEDRSVVEQAHEIHTLAKDLKNCSKESPCVLPNKLNYS